MIALDGQEGIVEVTNGIRWLTERERSVVSGQK